jgi:hypothetical protein
MINFVPLLKQVSIFEEAGAVVARAVYQLFANQIRENRHF